jgi:hypothetical protein
VTAPTHTAAAITTNASEALGQPSCRRPMATIPVAITMAKYSGLAILPQVADKPWPMSAGTIYIVSR